MGRGVTRPVRETAQCPKSNTRDFNGISPDREAVDSPVMDELKQQRRGRGPIAEFPPQSQKTG